MSRQFVSIHDTTSLAFQAGNHAQSSVMNFWFRTLVLPVLVRDLLFELFHRRDAACGRMVDRPEAIAVPTPPPARFAPGVHTLLEWGGRPYAVKSSWRGLSRWLPRRSPAVHIPLTLLEQPR